MTLLIKVIVVMVISSCCQCVEDVSLLVVGSYLVKGRVSITVKSAIHVIGIIILQLVTNIRMALVGCEEVFELSIDYGIKSRVSRGVLWVNNVT